MRSLKPNEHVNSIFDVDLNKLRGLGIKNLIIDIEDTIIIKDKWELSAKIIEWFNETKNKGFGIYLLTNSFYLNKVKEIAEKLNAPAISPAFKPFSYGFRHAIKILSSTPRNTAVIGDQLFTDVLGGNIIGAYTILVDHMRKEDNILRKMMRKLERKILES